MIMKNIAAILILLVSHTYGQSLERGISFYNKGKLKEAEKFFLTIDEDDHRRNYYLGRIAFDSNELDDAVDFFEDAAEKEKNSEYYTWLGNSLGVLAQNSNVFRQGILAPQVKDAYEVAVSIDPKNLDAQWGLLQYYIQAPGFMGGSYEKAEKTAIAIGATDPLKGCDAMISLYSAQEKYELLEKEYIKASKIDKDRLVNLGLFYQSKERFDEAFETFEGAYINDPTNYNSLYQIGRTSALSGKQLERGILCLLDYLKVEHKEGTPSHAGALMRLGMIYEKQGNKSKAIDSYKESLRQDPEMDLAMEGLERLK